ncbi:MAG: serine hydrolase [Alphaproteobacteria bacterium]|nr:serine hydrolase [Alphaproteobacteria bacterium]
MASSMNGIVAAAAMLCGCQHAVLEQETAAPAETVPGFTAEGVRDLRALMDEAVAAGRIPSAVAMLAQDGRIVWLETAGEMGPGTPMRRDVIMPLASVGKLYTAVAAMILLERGVIDLDDPVRTTIPAFGEVRIAGPDGELQAPQTPITIRHLLTHTSGLQLNGDAYWALWATHAGRTTTLAFAQDLARLPMRAEPGTLFEYGGTGGAYEVLAAVIETASGHTLEAFMQANIFAPLDLRETHFYVPRIHTARVPAFHRRIDDALRIETRYGEDAARSTYFYGGGGLASSPRDIHRFAQLILNDGEVDGVRLLRPDTVRAMMQDQIGALSPFGPALSWGYGAAVGRGPAAGQFGWVGGGYATLWVDRNSGLIAYFAFPVSPPGDNVLLTEFRRSVYAAMAPATP